MFLELFQKDVCQQILQAGHGTVLLSRTTPLYIRIITYLSTNDLSPLSLFIREAHMYVRTPIHTRILMSVQVLQNVRVYVPIPIFNECCTLGYVLVLRTLKISVLVRNGPQCSKVHHKTHARCFYLE